MAVMEEKHDRWKFQLAAVSVCLFVYRAASRSVIPFLPLFIRELGGTDPAQTVIWSGWIFAAPFIVSFFATPFWGSVGDRYGRKWIAAGAAFGAAFSYAMSGSAATLFQLLLYSSLQEAFGGFYPASVALVAAQAPKEKTASALGMMQFAAATGNIIGPVIGGVLATTMQYRNLFVLISAAVAVCGVFLLISVREHRVVSPADGFQGLTGNWRYVLQKHILLLCCAGLCIYAAGTALVRPTFALFVESFMPGMKDSAMTAGIIFGVFGGASALSSALLGVLQKKFCADVLLLSSAVVSGCFFILSGLTTSYIILTLTLAVTGFGLGIILPLLLTMMRLSTDDERIAGVLGVGSSFQMLGNLIAPVVSGYLVASLGLQIPFIVSGVMLIIPAILIARKGTGKLETFR